MEELSRCRINPNLRSTQRRDLEFFIPQICSFYITGYYSDPDTLVNFLLQAAHEFHFSHRLLFFYSSVLPDKATPEQQKVQITCIDRVVKGLLAQVNKLPERLFLTGSAELERTWLVYGMGDFYPQLAARQRESRPLEPGLLRLYRRRLDKVQALIDAYSARGFHNEGATIDQPQSRASLNDNGTGSTDEEDI